MKEAWRGGDRWAMDGAIGTEMCPFTYFMDVLGGKWKPAIVCILAANESVRFSSFKRHLTGVTNMILSRSLKELEEDGLVDRVQFNEIPLHVEYSLTEKGRSAVPALVAIAEWSTGHLGEDCGCNAHCGTCFATK